ncbi:MAG: thiamine pyrophosphate-dependent enzyme, partial [Firmicutes bacterium]|nr:thiamine pyrophosphate-dependent enzyme [Bacillota bacterium]
GRQGVVVAGAADLARWERALRTLARRLNWPLLADSLSNLRAGDPEAPLAAYDAVVRAPAARTLRPEVAVRFGPPPTSKALNTFLEGAELWVVDADGWREPSLAGAQVLWAEDLSPLEDWDPGRPGPRGWLEAWRTAEAGARAAMAAYLHQEAPPAFEGLLYHRLGRRLDPAAPVLAGNSMPVRDLDSFYWGSDPPLRLWGNRGANGIDGVVSTALGLAAGAGRAVAILGDLSFYHDMNGLLAAKWHRLQGAVVVVNNDAGGIFRYLPQAALPGDLYRELFDTPHGIDFSGVATLYGLPYRRAATVGEVEEALARAEVEGGLWVIDWRVLDPAESAAVHRTLWRRVEERLG